jgi:zinc protease
VQQWAKDSLTPHARLVIRVLPEAEADSPRASQPGIGDVAAFSPTEPESFKLSNGLDVRFWRRPALPLVAVELLVKSGSVSDGEHAGLATLTADMLDEGAAGMDAIAFGDALDALGATFASGAEHAASTVSLFVLQRNFGNALKLFADAVQRPRFTDADWDRVRKLHVESLRQDQDDPSAVARRVAARTLFGDAHPYGQHTDGTLASVEGISLTDVRAFHASAFKPGNVMMLVAGDLTVEALRTELEQTFGTWKPAGGAGPMASRDVPAPPERRFETFIVDRPDAVQTVISFIMPAPSYSDPNRVKLQLLNTIFGGSFTSRLNYNLREQKGYTYGARSRFALDPSVGYLTAGASVQTAVTGPALSEFFREFERIRDGDISTDEAEKARATVRNNLVSSFAELDGILEHAVTLAQNGLPFSTIAEDMKQLNAVSASDLNLLAREALPLERGVLVLVGDKKSILEQVAAIKLHVDGELDVEGNPIGGTAGTE